jgi:hypothetical protein
VRGWLAGCDYPDVRYIREAVGPAGLAERPRAEAAAAVTRAMARIYNRLAHEAATAYVWVLEDDVRPPPDACCRLLRGFDPQTGSVAAAYRSRSGGGYVAWGPSQRRYASEGAGVQEVGGNGFGCVVLRGGVLRGSVFTATLDEPAYDNAFYRRLAALGLKAKLDWSVACEHLAGGEGG